MHERMILAILRFFSQLALDKASIDNQDFFCRVFGSATLDQLADLSSSVASLKVHQLWESAPMKSKCDLVKLMEISNNGSSVNSPAEVQP